MECNGAPVLNNHPFGSSNSMDYLCLHFQHHQRLHSQNVLAADWAELLDIQKEFSSKGSPLYLDINILILGSPSRFWHWAHRPKRLPGLWVKASKLCIPEEKSKDFTLLRKDSRELISHLRSCVLPRHCLESPSTVRLFGHWVLAVSAPSSYYLTREKSISLVIVIHTWSSGFNNQLST